MGTFFYPSAITPKGIAERFLYYYFSVIQSVKDLFFIANQRFNPESGCKGKQFLNNSKIFKGKINGK